MKRPPRRADQRLTQEAAQLHLTQTIEQADQLRLEAQRLRDEAERRSRQLLDTAQRQAEDIVAEARAKTDRTRREAERELAALTHRRESINAQAAADKPGAHAPTPTGRSSTNTSTCP